MKAPVRSLDPVTFEVMKSTFDYICERMRWALQRVSMSPIIYDMVDYSVAIFTEDVQLVGQTAGCPIHIGALNASTQAAVKKFEGNFFQGDIVILNDAYEGGTHVPDVTMVAPMYYNSTLMGYACARAHWTDVGGGAAGGQAFGTHIATEGLRLPPMKIAEKGEFDEELVALIKNQTRMPQYVDGDIMSQVAALRVAEKEMKKFVDTYGIKEVKTGMKEVLDYTEYVYRQEIEKWSDGVYETEEYTETDGISEKQLCIKVSITIKGDHITVDFAGSGPRAEGAINSPLSNTMGAVYYSIAGMVLPYVQMNGGAYRVLDIKTPDNCWLNAKWPNPVIACTTHTSSKITAVIHKALSKAMPDRALGSTYAECNWFMATIKDPESGTPIVLSELPPGGWGGHAKADGIDTTMDPLGMCQNMPAETAEMAHPVTWDRFEMRTDSPGPGKNRGGMGMILAFTPLGDMEFSIETARTKIGTDGINGGGRSLCQYVLRKDPDGTIKTVVGWDNWEQNPQGKWYRPMQANQFFPAGSQCIILTTGGGGWGNPLEREPERVLRDVTKGYISIEGAKRDYGVIIDKKTIDKKETKKLREKLSISKKYRKHIQGIRVDYRKPI